MVNFTQSPRKPHLGSTDILAVRGCLDDLPRPQYHFIIWKLQKMAMQDEIWSVTPTQSLLDQPRWQLYLTYSLARSNSKLQHFKERHNHSFIPSFPDRCIPHLTFTPLIDQTNIPVGRKRSVSVPTLLPFAKPEIRPHHRSPYVQMQMQTQRRSLACLPATLAPTATP